MNPYYTVSLCTGCRNSSGWSGEIYRRAGLIKEDLDKLSGRDLGIAVANGMVELSRRVASQLSSPIWKGSLMST